MTPTYFEVDGYRLAVDRYYDEATHLWVADAAPPGTASLPLGPPAGTVQAVRCGFDPLGSETSGDVVAVSFEPVGTRVARGEAFGSLEAAKFVGPLLAPITGTLRRHNDAVIENPGLVNRDPLAHWLVEIEPEQPDEELPLLLHDPQAVVAWFRREVERFRTQGMVAE